MAREHLTWSVDVLEQRLGCVKGQLHAAHIPPLTAWGLRTKGGSYVALYVTSPVGIYIYIHTYLYIDTHTYSMDPTVTLPLGCAML
jgi:hypothetical protein